MRRDRAHGLQCSRSHVEVPLVPVAGVPGDGPVVGRLDGRRRPDRGKTVSITSPPGFRIMTRWNRSPISTSPASHSWIACRVFSLLRVGGGEQGGAPANLDMVANVRRGWYDPAPAGAAPDAELLGRVAWVYGARTFCPDGGAYTLSADGRSCRYGVHGGHNDPRQPAGPTESSPTGRLLKSFAGLTAALRFEEVRTFGATAPARNPYQLNSIRVEGFHFLT